MADHHGSLLVTAWGSPIQDHHPLAQHFAAFISMEPPAGEKWTGHSLLSGGGSASLAIGCEMFHIIHHVVWKLLAAVQQYLSMIILPSTTAYIFFGWMQLLPQGQPPPPPPLEIDRVQMGID